ncbi:MAG TPA: DMT family transporter [Chloroflexota bacterium]
MMARDAPSRGASRFLGPPTVASPGPLAYLALVVAVVAVSWSAIFIRLATAPPLVIATHRMFLAVLLLLPFFARGGWRELRRLRARHVAALGLSGVALAAHFGLWTLSLRYTSVASSVLFVSLHPALVAALGWAVFREPTTRLTALGIALTALGSAMLGASDVRVSGQAILGDALALGGAVALVAYLLVGRALRGRLGSAAYSTPVYAVCGVTLLAGSLVAGDDVLAVTPRDWALFLALAAVCTVGGHTVFNWALRYVPTAGVAIAFVGEPVVATGLAWLLLSEAPSALTMAGGLVTLAGLVVAWRGTTSTAARAPGR